MSRVGGAAQIKAMRQVAARCGWIWRSIVKSGLRAVWERSGPGDPKAAGPGQRLTELLKQGQYVPMPVERQVIAIYAGTHGALDKHPVSKVGEFERGLAQFVDQKYPEIYREILEKGKLDAALEAKINQAIKEFDANFSI